MNIHQLEIFVVVYRVGSMVRAAEQMAIAQPAVSRCIHELECEYNATFFVRNGRALASTDEGDRFYGYAIQILDLLHSLKEEFSDVHEVRIGCTPTLVFPIGRRSISILVQHTE